MMRKISDEESVLLTICLYVVVAIFPFFIYRIISDEYIQAVLDGVIVLTYILVILNVFIFREVKRSRLYLLLLCFVSITSVVNVCGAHNIYWIFPASIGIYYLYSPIKSFLLSSTLCALVLLVAYQKIETDLLVTILFTYFIVNRFSYLHSKKIRKQYLALKESTSLALVINNILENMVSSKSLNKTLNTIALNFEQQFSTMLCSILLVDSKNDTLVLMAAPSLPDFYNKIIDNFPIGNESGCCGTAAYRGVRIIVSDLNNDLFCQPYTEVFNKANLHSCWSEPIKDSEGKVLGTFAIYQHKVSSPTPQDIQLLEQFAHLASIAIERDKANKLIWQQANFDSLTKLPNRNMMLEKLSNSIEKAAKEKTKVAIAFVDLDNFKYVNDSLGHAAGDKLLITVAQRIMNNVRKNDIVARLGGDEFILILNNITDFDSIDKLSKNLLVSLSSPYNIDNEEVNISASIGITIYPNDSHNISNLLNNADQAMYKAKHLGKNFCCFFH